jgi:hypothetical protein
MAPTRALHSSKRTIQTPRSPLSSPTNLAHPLLILACYLQESGIQLPGSLSDPEHPRLNTQEDT